MKNAWRASNGALVAVGTCLAILALAAPALAERRPLTIVDKLAIDEEVQNASRMYETVSAGQVLYDRCATEYGVEAAKKTEFTDRLFQQVGVAYMKAFENAHARRTTKLPSDATIALYTQAIADQQLRVKTNIVKVLEDRGCGDDRLQAIDEFLIKYRRQMEEQQGA